MAGYTHGLQAARERLARAQSDLRAAREDEARSQRLQQEAERLEAETVAIRQRLQPAPVVRRPAAETNVYGGRAGLAAAVREAAAYSRRKREQKEPA